MVYSSRMWILVSDEVPVKFPCHRGDTEATEPVSYRTALQTVPWEAFFGRARLCAKRSPPVKRAKFTCRCSRDREGSSSVPQTKPPGWPVEGAESADEAQRAGPRKGHQEKEKMFSCVQLTVRNECC